MPVTAEELVRVLAMLAEEEKLRVAVKESLKGGAMAGTGAVIGGFMGGPVGIAIGKVLQLSLIYVRLCSKLTWSLAVN